MNCPSCQTANPEGARFCMSCGSPLASPVCPECRTELPSGAKFCPSCGHQVAVAETPTAPSRLQQYIPKELLAKLDDAKSAGGMQGERRVVTMLFCDVQGSTAAAQRLDPEEWAEIMNGAFEHLIAPVYRYEGTLARLMGDAILAFFGAPIAHEDDAERAVRAGLDIVEGIGPYREEVRARWGIDFDVRVGINTGLVVVGEVGSDLRVEYTALGDAINMAARMEQTAQAGTIQVSADTHRLVAPLFEFEDLGEIEVKGRDEPVPAYRALHPKAERGRVRGIEGLDAPLIGRDSEVRTLMDAVAALRQGRGQIVSLMGEAGLGKSRLIAELRQALVVESRAGTGSSNGSEIAWHEGRCLSYEATAPYTPFSDLLSGYFGLRDGQQGANGTDSYETLKAAVGSLMPDRVDDVAPYLAMMLGLSPAGPDAELVRYLQPPQVRDRAFRATRELFERMAADRPLVLVFEDMHWSDPTSLDLVAQLMEMTDRAPVMMIMIFRPGRQESSWRLHETGARDYAGRYSAVTLEPLDAESSRHLVGSLLHIEDLPESVRALILKKAEGNPFFVEEVVRSLIDSGLIVREDDHWRATSEIADIAVPDTVAGVITSRIDRLNEKSRRAAQTASVIGREFGFDILQDAHDAGQDLGELVMDLQQRELIHEKDVDPRLVYMFKHALTQETVYSTLLLSTRREMHRRVAECLEQIDKENVNDIARHYMESREQGRALPYLAEAGDRAARAYSTNEAIGYYTQALQVLSGDGVQDLSLAKRVYEGLGGALTFGQRVGEAVENYHTMLHVAQEHGDLPMQVSALNKLGWVTALMQGQFPEAEEHLVDAERLALECDDLSGLAELHMTYCYLRIPFGNFEDAVDHLNESDRIGRELDLEEPRLFGLTHKAQTLLYMTRFEDAWAVTQEAVHLAKELGNRKWLSELVGFPTAFYHLRNGDLDATSEAAEQGLNIAAQIGAVEQEGYGSFMAGLTSWLRGDYERAISFQERTAQTGRACGFPFIEAMGLCALGTAYLDVSADLLDKTAELHGQAMKLLETPMGAVMGGLAWSDLGFCALAVGDVEAAGDLFDKGLSASNATK